MQIQISYGIVGQDEEWGLAVMRVVGGLMRTICRRDTEAIEGYRPCASHRVCGIWVTCLARGGILENPESLEEPVASFPQTCAP